jgi:hypothetical protein
MENVQIFAQLAISLKQQVETVLNVMINVKVAMVQLINVHHVLQVLPAMEFVLPPVQLTLLMSLETASLVLKDVMVVKIQLINVQLANRDISHLELNVLQLVMLDISEMEIMDAKNVQILVNNAALLLLAQLVLNQEINQSMAFATAVFIHVQHVLHMNNVLLV